MDNDRLVRIYLKMKAKKAALKREFEKAEAEINENMETVSGLLMKSLLDAKVSSMGADSGTFYIKKTIKPSCTDWEVYRKWMIENDALDGVEKRVTKSFIANYMADNKDDLPPGITVHREQVVEVRSKTEKA